MNNNKSNLKINFILNTGYQVFCMIFPLLITPYVCRILGAELIGSYSYTAANVGYFALFAAMGTIIYGNREISFLQSKPQEYSRTFWEIELLSIFSTMVCLVVFIVFVLLNRHYQALYFIQLFTLLSVAGNINWFFQGLENFKTILLRNTFFKIVSLLFIFAFVKSKSDLLLYVGGLVVIEFIGNISLWLTLPKYLTRVDIRSLRPFRHLKPTLLLFIPTITSSIYTMLDKTMLGIFTSSKIENGYYEESYKLAKYALAIVLSVETVMLPRISALFGQGKMDELKNLLYKSYRFVCFLAMPICFGLISVASLFVPIYYGPGYDKVEQLLYIHALLIPIIGLSNVTGIQYLITTKQDRKLITTVTTGAAVNVIMNLILIPQLHSIGASIASVAAELVIAVFQFILVRGDISFVRVAGECYKYLLSALVMCGSVWTAKTGISGLGLPDILQLALLVIVGGIVYLLMLLLLRDSFFIDNAKLIIRKIKR